MKEQIENCFGRLVFWGGWGGYLPGFVDLICFKIFNIKNLSADIKHKIGHNSGPRGSPMARIWHAPSYHTPKRFSMPKGHQF